jgi:glutathione reductase (NADPH)
MWHAADMADKLRHAADGYHFNIPQDKQEFSWATFKPQRDAYIRFLNGIYDKNVNSEGVSYHDGHAKLTSPTSIEIQRNDGTKYTIHTSNVVIATGGRPVTPSDNEIPGASLGIDSDGFFALEDRPKRVAVVGAGYIAVELAGVLNALGSETHIIARYDKVLRKFDPSLQDVLLKWMQHTGINFHGNSKVVKIEGQRGGPLSVHTNAGEVIQVDVVLWAISRRANTENLGLEDVGVELDAAGNVIVDEWQESNIKGVFSIGDVQGKAQLTPVAIAAGRRLSNRLYGGQGFKYDKLDYTNIPTVVFS